MPPGSHRVDVIRVEAVEPHPNADRLGIVRPFGYQVAVALGEFKPGDLAAYVPPDSMVDTRRLEFAFLRRGTSSSGFETAVEKKPRDFERIKVKKLRGLYSQGLLIKAPDGAQPGDDVAEALGVTHYEPPSLGTASDAEHGPEGLHVPVFDVESYRRYPNKLPLDETVVVSEKLHGCVQARTRISMVDGTRRNISEVVADDVVLGVRDGKVVPARVIRAFHNGTTAHWLRVSGTRRAAGRGNAFFALYCTPEHKFWCPSVADYVIAGRLRAGDTVTLLRSELGLTPIQEQVLLGKMLGDGSLYDSSHSAHLTWGHRVEDAAYGDWTAGALGDLSSDTRESHTSGYGTEMLRWRTVNSAWIKEFLGGFWSATDKKRIPSWVADSLTPIALAFWYMDDGSLGHGCDGSEDKANFAVCDFTEADCSFLITGLSRMGINAVYYVADGYSRLRLNADDAERLFLLVAPYIPPCMQRKLPERYRGGSGWLPRAEQVYKPLLVHQTIVDIEAVDTSSSTYDHYTVRHDLETETGNYFANGVLVHNSNMKATWHAGRFWVGSHRQWKKESDNAFWRAFRASQPLQDLLVARNDLVAYGECYGWVQDLRYGARSNEVRLALFDLWSKVTGTFLDWQECGKIRALFDLPWVPVIATMPFAALTRDEDNDRAELLAHAEGPSLVPGADHLREGCVIRPVTERWDEEIGRVILKIVSNTYLERA